MKPCRWICTWICACTWACVCAITPFHVYWNVPSQECQRFGVSVNVSRYGLVQNTGDKFNGDKVTILYGPGGFPYLKVDAKGHLQPVNGGLPQNGSLVSHVQSFIHTLDRLVPRNFTGAAVLDFEEYYPSLQNSPQLYKEASRAWVRERYPTWSEAVVNEYARVAFNASAKNFFQSLLWVSRELRPGGLWGYYHYPYCSNYRPGDAVCRKETQLMNNELEWLFRTSAALYPSLYVYLKAGFTPRSRRMHASTILKEALTVRRRVNPTIPVLPYFWYRYHDSPLYLSPMDMVNTLGWMRLAGADGAVVWGSRADLATKAQCYTLKIYAEYILGPMVRYLIQLPLTKLRRTIASRAGLRRAVKIVLQSIL